MWTRPARILAAALLAALALSGCSDDDGGDTATDPGSDPTTQDTPTADPTVGTYPAFEAEDYAYTLQVSCFCPDAGVPIRVTVADGEISEAVYGEKGAGHQEGDAAPEYWELSINDIIDELNAATDAENVQVKWPDGQDYPSSVSIDQSSKIADEEIGYTISSVDVG
jgi:hypothetical protein